MSANDHPTTAGYVGPLPTQAEALAWAAERGYDVTPQGRAFKAVEELGEVAEAIIKVPEGRKTEADLRQETAQLALCVMGIAEAAGFDLTDEIRAEWVRANPHLLAERIEVDGLCMRWTKHGQTTEPMTPAEAAAWLESGRRIAGA